MPLFPPLLQVDELLRLQTNTYVLCDVSGGLEAPPDKVLRNSSYIHPDTELAEIGDYKTGGRHPLPKITDFCIRLQEAGIMPDSHVILYDRQKGSNAAARMWWMLTALGHPFVQVLDGGFAAAVNAGFPLTTPKQKQKNNGAYLPSTDTWLLPTASLEDVTHHSLHIPNSIIDVRATERYEGYREPIDLVAGHIPHAINIPFTENLDDYGFFLPAERLRKKYLPYGSSCIVHCGSGITACHTLLAFAIAELPLPRLYVGSWSEWSRNDKPIISKGSE